MTKILLNYDDKLHTLLWNEKEQLSIFWARNVTWEEFFVIKSLGATAWQKRNH